jgi:hypothetical protein
MLRFASCADDDGLGCGMMIPRAPFWSPGFGRMSGSGFRSCSPASAGFIPNVRRSLTPTMLIQPGDAEIFDPVTTMNARILLCNRQAHHISLGVIAR